jgi:hypothetical protein
MRSPLKGPAYMRSQGASLGCREFSLGVQKGGCKCMCIHTFAGASREFSRSTYSEKK